MSVPINLHGLPSHVLENVYKFDGQKMARSAENALSPLTFPKSKAVLWDPTPKGEVVNLHLCYNRNPRLLLIEKALRLAHRHARQSNRPQFTCFLLGNIVVDADEEGVTVTLDRFDPGREQPDSSGKVPTALLPGDILVPCVFGAQGMETNTVFSAEDLNISFKMLQHCCSSREPLELAKLLILRGRLACSQQADSQGFSLRWAAVTVANTLDLVPVRAVPIIPTALARNLSAPSSLAQPLNSASRKQGFLTMDKTRKLLLILKSDPKAYTLPLVGVWLSGITHISNPQVWAWCVEYLFSTSLQDRVMSESGCFLVVLYSLTHREPEFYQCQAGSRPQEMAFQLLTGTESLTLYKDVEVLKGQTVQCELSAESQNSETEFFREVLSHSSLTSARMVAVASPQTKLSACDHDSGVEDEDLSPRPSPNPHPLTQQTKRIHPSVPELSLVEGSIMVGMRMSSHDSQHRGSSPDYYVHSGPRPPGQEAPLNGPPPLRRPLLPVTHKGKGTSTPEHQQSLGYPSNRKTTPPFGTRAKDGRLASSSSSPSSVKFCPSPNESLHQHRQHRALDPHKAAVSLLGPSPHCSPKHSPEPPASVLTSQQSLTHPNHFHSTPNSNLSQPCPCCATQFHNHTPIYYHPDSLKGATVTPTPLREGHPPAPHWDSNPTPRPSDCCLASSHRARSQHNPACLTGGMHLNNPSAHAACTPVRAAQSRGCAEPAPPSVCLNPLPADAASSPQTMDGPTGLLPADAYRILQDQDRQLKLLHAQIQKLLEAQEKAVSQSPSTEQAAMQTQTHCVSVAVGTGASLFWADPVKAPSHEESPQQDRHAESELSVLDGSRTSRRSSGIANLTHRQIDRLEEYVEGEEQVPCSPSSQSMLRHQAAYGSACFQSPVLGESASMYYQSPSPESSNPARHQTRTADDEHKFYQELLGQVNSRLQASVNEEVQEEMESSRRTSPPRERDSLSPEVSPYQTPASDNIPYCSWKPAPSSELPDRDRVLSATLHQLKQLGVSVELDSADPGKAMRATVESASTLAFINPEAVMPRLTLPESTGTSMWGLGSGVDLSLEANAIALKYLSDSQLVRLSLGSQQSPRSKLLPSVALLSGKPCIDKSTTGLSLFSPSNMSIATQKYMKRYGLMEGNSNEEERGDDDGDDGIVQAKQFQQQEQIKSLALKNRNYEATCSPSPLFPRAQPLDSQSQLLRDLRPKMQLLNNHTKSTQGKENCAKQRPSLDERRKDNPQSEGSVGNFLDLSRLRQLPKLF